MSNEYQKILESALTLPQNEQLELIQALFSKIKEDELPQRMSWETDELFKELDQRISEIDSEKVKPISGSEVMKKLRKKML